MTAQQMTLLIRELLKEDLKGRLRQRGYQPIIFRKLTPQNIVQNIMLCRFGATIGKFDDMGAIRAVGFFYSEEDATLTVADGRPGPPPSGVLPLDPRLPQRCRRVPRFPQVQAINDLADWL